jgi:hydroxymethylpyrimidine/phosphomethylpyrimidine kinase
MREAARRIHAMGCRAVVVKGGHMANAPGPAFSTDILLDGESFYEYSSPRVDTKHTHGTGCTYSSAIASNLAIGLNIRDAVESAKKYIDAAIANAPGFGKGNGPTHHFHDMYMAYFRL